LHVSLEGLKVGLPFGLSHWTICRWRGSS